jgi:hypothetical protein
VWLGVKPHRKWPGLPNLTATHIPSYPATVASQYDGWTYAIGHCVLQVLYRQGREDRPLYNGAELAGIVTRVSPVSIAPVAWPPKYVLARDDVRALGLSIVAPVHQGRRLSASAGGAKLSRPGTRLTGWLRS